MTPTTHDTFVIGIKNGSIAFLKSYEYFKQKEECNNDLKYVQDQSLFNGWYCSHVGQWILEHKITEEETFGISIPLPKQD